MAEPFFHYMQRALYDPELGYYARRREIGRQGDFYTSVSVGGCFGDLLAEYVAARWLAAGSPTTFAVVEQGTNQGQLAADVLQALKSRHSACFEAINYHILEPLPELAAWQQGNLAAWAGKTTWHETAATARFQDGVFLANELLDAFPVELVRQKNEAWHRMGVEEAVLVEMPCPLPSSLAEAIAKFPEPAYPEGYQTEIMPGLPEWWAETSALFSRHGAWLICDYGLNQEDYYAAHRHQGTLRGYRQHQMLPNFPEGFVFGETDLTSHVNWTQVAAAAQAQGLRTSPALPQTRFLSRLAAPLLLAIERGNVSFPDAAAWIRQFQMLTHPAHLGEKFQVLEVLTPPATS